MSRPFRIIVTGSRDYPIDVDSVGFVSDVILRAAAATGARHFELKHGGGRGLDAIVDQLARGWGWEVTPFPAHWMTPPRKKDPAGPIRNDAMASSGAELALAFPIGDSRRSPGTWDCIEACARALIEVRIYPRGAR
jgi:hypothetical protein